MVTTANQDDTRIDRSYAAPVPVRRVFWGAIFAGAVVAIVVQLVLSLLGTGIGMSTLDPLQHSSPDASTFGIVAGLWWVLTSILSLFAGGWVAGHLAGAPDKEDAMLHGLVTWGLTAIATVYLLSSIVGSIVSGGASVVSTAATAAGSAVAAAAGPAANAAKQQLQESGISVDSLMAQAKQLLEQTGKSALQPQSIQNQADSAANKLTATENTQSPDDLQATVQRIISQGKDTVDQADREALVNVVMARTSLSRPEAEARVNNWVQGYEKARATFQQKKAEAKQKAREVADAAAKYSAQAALAAVLALVLGALAAGFGGSLAGRRFYNTTGDNVTVAHRT